MSYYYTNIVITTIIFLRGAFIMSKKSKELKNDNRIYLNKSNILKLGMKEKAELIYEAIEAWKLSYTDYVNSYLSLFSYDFVFPSDSLGTLKGTYYSALDDSKIKYEVITYISPQYNSLVNRYNHIYIEIFLPFN